jgi:hypothetical protein
MTPKKIPFAIDVTDEIPNKGKHWSGGVGNSKLVFHTIEGADPWDIGWPRTWSRWTSAPHLAMNSNLFPNPGWLYQTIYFDKAAYAIRDNDLEDDAYTYQMEMAGRARNVEDYPDQFYEAIATVADWMVAVMGVPDTWMDFSCAQAGVDSPCRHTKDEIDRFAGFLGHCHVGTGIDKHWDPGKLDVQRARSFMTTGGAIVGCPWTNNVKGQPWYHKDPPCNDHYDAGRTLAWGINTGVCAVPAYGIDAVDYQIAEKVIIVGDNNRDDFRRNLTDGRWWVMDYRKEH